LIEMHSYFENKKNVKVLEQIKNEKCQKLTISK